MRKCQSVIQSICKYSESTEIPAIFSIWAGIGCVSAAIGRDCFVDQGYFCIYPNVYIIFVAGSARCRKSTAVNMGKWFIEQVQPKINTVSQKLTPEGLIGALSGMIGDEGASQVVPSATGIAVVDELSTLIDRNAFKSGLIALLTNLYDAQDFEYLTRSRGREIVKNPCLSVLGASTIHWIKEAIPEVSIGGGFTSRVIFIYKDKRERLVPWPEMTEENKQRAADIVHDLCEISKMRGPMALEPDALEIYKKEYEHFYHHSQLMINESLSGYANRRHHILLKIAMIISASRCSERLITVGDLGASINILRKAEESMPLVLRTIVSEKCGDIFEEIVRFVMSHKIVSRQQLVKEFRNKMTSKELDIMMQTLEEEGVVIQQVESGTMRYIFKGESL